MTRRTWLLIAAFYVLLSIAATWPVITDPARAVARTNDDLYYMVWLHDWTRRALFELHVSPLAVPHLNYPAGWNVGMADWPIATVAMGLPFNLLGGPILGLNASILLSDVLSGLAAFAWVHRRTGSMAAALVAGAAFTVAPYRAIHLDHPSLLHTEWLPLYLLALEDTLRGHGRRPLLAPVAVGALMGLIAFTSQYYMMMTLVITVPYALVVVLQEPRNRLRARGFWRGLLVAGAVAAPLLLLAELPLLSAARRGVIQERNLDSVRVFAASPTDFVMPPMRHPLWGEWSARQHRPDPQSQERDLYLGLVTVFLAGYAVAVRKGASWDRAVPPLVVLGLVGMVLALGTDLHWMSEPVRVDTAAFPGSLLAHFGGYVPLPQRALFKFVPFYASMRAWARYGVYAMLATTLLAGLGLAHLLGRLHSRRARLAVAALALILVGLDFARVPLELTRLESRSVDYWLAGQPDRGALIELPIALSNRSQNVYYSIVHEKRYVGCYGGTFDTPEYLTLKQELATPFSMHGVRVMQALGIYYVVIDTSLVDDWAQQHAALDDLGLSPLYAEGNYQVMGLAATPRDDWLAAPSVRFGDVQSWTSGFSVQGSGWLDQERHPRLLADVNGDGRADIIGFADQGTRVALSTGTSFGPMRTWSAHLGGDEYPSQDATPRLAGDMDGDGRADVVLIAPEGVMVALSLGEGLAAPHTWSPPIQGAGAWLGQALTPCLVGDVDGDGRADLVAIGPDGVFVARSTGVELEPARVWSEVMTQGAGWADQVSAPRALADQNGDGLADLIGFSSRGVEVAHSTGSAFAPPRLLSAYFCSAAGWENQEVHPRLVGDVSGDGLADVVGFGQQHVFAAWSNDAGLYPAEQVYRHLTAGRGGWLSQSVHPRALADVNGDGRLDLVGFGARGVYVALAQIAH